MNTSTTYNNEVDSTFIIPAIDIIGGKCVRLTKGDYSTSKIYYEDPLEAAKYFAGAGIRRLHMVDLDGAKAGSIQNLASLERVAAATDLVIDFGGGVKKIDDINSIFNAGAAMVTIGSLAVKNPGLMEELVLEFGPEKLFVGADVLDEKIKIAGWLEDGGITVTAFISKMAAAGVLNIFCTDISRDGMMKGPSVDLYKKIIQSFPDINLTASGGANNIKDVIKLKEAGCKGVIIGKAIYEGNITMKEIQQFN